MNKSEANILYQLLNSGDYGSVYARSHNEVKAVEELDRHHILTIDRKMAPIAGKTTYWVYKGYRAL